MKTPPALVGLRSVPLLALLSVLSFTITTLSAAPNLIPNGDFESEASESAPGGWLGSIDGIKNPPEMYVREGTPGKDVHAGTHAMKLFVSAKGSAGGENKRRNVLATIRSDGKTTEPPIKLEPGKSYRFSFWIKREGFEDPAHTLVAEFSGVPYPEPGDIRLALAIVKNLSGPCEWEKHEAECSVPADSTISEGYVIFRLFFPAISVGEGSKSVAYIDDVELVQEK